MSEEEQAHKRWGVRLWPPFQHKSYPLHINLLRHSGMTTDDRNALNLCVELFWAALMSCVASFNAAFALRLGAQNRHIALLTSLPALMAAVISIPAGRFLERCTNFKRWVLGSLLVHRLGYALVACLPWLPSWGANRGAILVALLIIIGLPAHFFNVGFHALLAEVVPPRRRAAVFATRSTINVATTSIGLFLVGQWLSRIAYPFNYQTAYLGGLLAGMLSMVYLYRLRVPDARASAPVTSPNYSLPQTRWREALKLLQNCPQFMRFTINTFIYNLAAWAVAPLYVLYYVRERGADEGWLGLLGTVSNVSAIVGYAIWRRVIARRGEYPVLRLSASGAGIFPILAGISPTLPPILAAAALDGLIVTAINLSHYTMFLRVVPDERRPLFIGVYITLMNAGAFLMPLVGVALAEWAGLTTIILGCGVCRFLTGLLFHFWPIREAQPAEVTQQILTRI